MTTTLQRPARTSAGADLKPAAPELAQLEERRGPTHIEQTHETTDRVVERHRRARQLVALADGSRRRLEDLHVRLLRRLHRTSSDFEGTEALLTVELALSMTPRPEGVWAWQRREQERPRRWWQRRGRRNPR
jgi:hypothetical protein